MNLKEKLKIINKNCRNCDRELVIPKGIASLVKEAKKPNGDKTLVNQMFDKQCLEFYISPSGSFYCNKNCYTMFTED